MLRGMKLRRKKSYQCLRDVLIEKETSATFGFQPSKTSLLPKPKALEFLDLPVEIRLLVYKELLLPYPDVKRLLCSCNGCLRDEKFPVYHDPSRLYPSILTTNKKIYSEALPVLYSSGIFRIFCNHWTRGSFPQFNLLLPFSHPLFLVPFDNDAGRPYIHRAFVDFRHDRELREFPEVWTKIEDRILESYPNLEHVTISLYAACDFTIELTRQARKPQTEPLQRLQEYFGLFGYPACSKTRQVREMCRAITPMQDQEALQHTVFGIQAVNWWGYGRKGEIIERTVYPETGICVFGK